MPPIQALSNPTGKCFLISVTREFFFSCSWPSWKWEHRALKFGLSPQFCVGYQVFILPLLLGDILLCAQIQFVTPFSSWQTFELPSSLWLLWVLRCCEHLLSLSHPIWVLGLIAGLYQMCVSIFTRNLQAIFQSNCTILHPGQQWMSIPGALVPSQLFCIVGFSEPFLSSGSDVVSHCDV